MAMKKFLPFLTFVCLCVGSVNAGPEHKISAEQAKALVMASLSPQQRALPNVEAEQYSPPKPTKFLFFTVTWEGPTNGSVVVGNYAVDPQTGDVWSATSSCEEETNKGLRALQSELRATALRLPRSQYHQLKTKGPLCD